jgi:hypothetical protein
MKTIISIFIVIFGAFGVIVNAKKSDVHRSCHSAALSAIKERVVSVPAQCGGGL